jgi:hypothetical protein
MFRSLIRTATALLLLTSFDARSADLSPDSRTRSAELSALGDRLFREARFEEAEAAYSRALDLDQRNVHGHLGIGKIASLFSEGQRATSHYAAAYQIAPRDPDAVLAFASAVENPEARQVLLRNFLTLAKDARIEDVRARLRVAEQIGTSTLSSLNSPYQLYRIPLFAIRTDGLLLRARINHGRELKLVLDTGATGIVLNASALKASGESEMNLEFLADAALSGFGSATPALARIARAVSFETGGLKMANLLLDVSETDLTQEADGLIGLDVFKDFLIRLDSPSRILELTPFDEAVRSTGVNGPACGECMRAYRLGSLLLVRGTINAHAEGYFILDSGSPYSMISRKLVSQDGRAATFEGAQGGQQVAVPSPPLTIRLGTKHLMDFKYATFDAAEISSRNGTEIAGPSAILCCGI